MGENRLDRETSPYLLQHKDNPVHWRAWGAEALAEAQARGAPVLLSVGYAACHWCHVMAHESFEDPAIAAVMNDLFVCVKVDREERPDIDQIYQQALALLGQQGGWPLTMFLTPQGEPFWGGTYFPPESRWGRPGFPDVLRGIARVWRDEREKVVAGNVAALMKGLARLSSPKTGGLVDPSVLDSIATRFAGAFDKVHGGLGGAPKFPNCSILELVWRGWKRSGDAAMRDAVLISLDAMCQGGIYDHLGGAFARYSTDERWLVPHFEKMLYDNAQLIPLLLWAWQETGAALYRQRIEETVGWVLAEMKAPEGGFAATIDADSEHEEGKYYVWTEAEIDAVLGADAALFKSLYDVTPHGNWEEKTILNRLAKPFLADDATETALAACRQKLLAVRRDRVPPARDDKVLADWNGLMIAALAQAAPVFGRADWLDEAVASWRFVTTRMMEGDRLRHSWRQGRHQPGTLDDHANMANAAIALYEATGDTAYIAQAEAWVRALQRHFAAAEGGFYLTADDTEALIRRTKSAADSAVPSGNGAALAMLVRLHALTGDDGYRVLAEALIQAFSGELERDYFSLAAYLNGIDLWAHARQVVVVGDRAEAGTQALLAAVQAVSLPNRILSVIRPGEALPALHPAFGKTQEGGKATAYVCRGQTCSLPVTEPAALKAALQA
ncbi:MAG TPA: thioredoxin domain-containing protein [Stellaceae bacterium]|nr:thioredoxin domain-containing protein [Stellaceae bacterium]